MWVQGVNGVCVVCVLCWMLSVARCECGGCYEVCDVACVVTNVA